jgi:hypothetical protein
VDFAEDFYAFSLSYAL